MEVFSSIDLPCGKTVRNRLVKVALYEHLATFLGGTPNELHYKLYSTWSKADWGMIMTGNVQVSPTHLSLGRDMVVPAEVTPETLKPFEKLAKSMHGTSSSSSRPLAIMQLSHSGRQATTLIGGSYPWRRPLAPSEVRVLPKGQGCLANAIHRVAFMKPKAMTGTDIDEVVEAFARGALLAHQAGFDGVELHAAHGYLLAQFLSAKTNKRLDEYSLRSENGLRLLHEIVAAIRGVVPPDFALGIKINAADYTGDNSAVKDDSRIQAHAQAIASWGGVDFIEVTGGDYESPEFMRGPSKNSPRQALFARFSRAAVSALETLPKRNHPLPLILLTGGLRSPELIQGALTSGHAHLLGIGRGSILNPDLPELLKSRTGQSMRPEPDLSPTSSPIATIASYFPTIPLIGAGVITAWYTVAMRRLATTNVDGTVSEISHDERSIARDVTDDSSFGSHSDQKVKPRTGVIGGDLIASGELRSIEPDYSVGAVGALIRMWAWINFAQA